MIKLNKRDFMKWLSEKNPTTKVGNPGYPKSCPLACYLKSRGAEYAWVGMSTYRSTLPNEGAPFNTTMPEWAMTFVDLIDKKGDATLRAKTALYIMKSL